MTGGFLMEPEKLCETLKSIKGMGYELISLDASELGRLRLELGVPVFVNNRGDLVDPETGEPLPRIRG
jgi:hypothetical protein